MKKLIFGIAVCSALAAVPALETLSQGHEAACLRWRELAR